MAKVTVVGAGIAGLATALYATTAGHHVVVLERTDRLGGKGTSQTVDNAPFGYGLHLLLHRGPLMKLVKKISRLPLVLSSPRLDRLNIPAVGAIRPRNNVRLAAQHRRALRQGDTTSPVAQAASLLAGSGHPDYGSRYVALNRQRLSFVGEGWSGVVGRMAAALDEVGVLIEANCHVTSIENRRVQLKDGRAFESDVVVLACGVQQAKRLLKVYDTEGLSGVKPVFVSTVDVTLDAKPLAALHGIIDPSEGAYVVDSNNIQPRLQLPGLSFCGHDRSKRRIRSREDGPAGRVPRSPRGRMAKPRAPRAKADEHSRSNVRRKTGLRSLCRTRHPACW